MKHKLRHILVYLHFYNLHAETSPLSIAAIVFLVTISAAFISSIFIPNQLMAIFGNDLGCRISLISGINCSPIFLGRYIFTAFLIGILLGACAGMLTFLVFKSRPRK